MDVSAIVAGIAVVFTVAFAWPQVFRALRHGVHGIAPGAIVQSLVSASMWFGYGVARRLPEVMLADLGVISGQLLVTILLLRAGVLRAWQAAAVVAAGATAIGLAQVPVLTGPVVLLGGVMGLTSAGTQLVEVLREPDKLEGLSAGSYLILMVLAAAWLGYGLDKSDWAIIAPNIVMVPMAGYITVAAWRSHSEEAGEPAPTGAPALAPQVEC